MTTSLGLGRVAKCSLLGLSVAVGLLWGAEKAASAGREAGERGPRPSGPILPADFEEGETSLLERYFAATAAAATRTTFLHVSVESNGGNVVTAQPGEEVRYEVVGWLSHSYNDGLALVGFDLDFTGGDLPPADTPIGDPDSGCENPMMHFTPPWGLTNPAGFGGTVINGNLIWMP